LLYICGFSSRNEVTRGSKATFNFLPNDRKYVTSLLSLAKLTWVRFHPYFNEDNLRLDNEELMWRRCQDSRMLRDRCLRVIRQNYRFEFRIDQVIRVGRSDSVFIFSSVVPEVLG
jgi:hypothetical protein